MGLGQHKGGRGTNQYGVKGVSIADDVALAENVRGMKDVSVPQQPRTALASDRSAHQSIASLVAQLDGSIESHLDMITRGRYASPKEISDAIASVSSDEEGILQRFPGPYGFLVKNATWWERRKPYDNRIKNALAEGDPVATELDRGYSRLRRDALGTDRLDVDDLARTLEQTAANEEMWEAGTAGETQEGEGRQLAYRHAAISVVSSRGGDPSGELRREQATISEKLNRERVGKIGI